MMMVMMMMMMMMMMVVLVVVIMMMMLVSLHRWNSCNLVMILTKIYVMCFFLPRDMGGILILRKMRKNEKV